MDAGTTSRLGTRLDAKPKFTCVRLNSQTPCPPPGAVPANQGCCVVGSSYIHSYKQVSGLALAARSMPFGLHLIEDHVSGVSPATPRLTSREPIPGFGGALWELCGSLEVALGWLWGRNRLPINKLWGGFEVALGWPCRLFIIHPSSFILRLKVRSSRFKVRSSGPPAL